MRNIDSIFVQGVANSTVQHSGLVSTRTIRRNVLGVFLIVEKQVGNLVQIFVEREKFIELYDYNIDSYGQLGSSNSAVDTNKPHYFLVDKIIPEGETLYVAIQCGATVSKIYGGYEYEEVGR